MRTIDDVSLSLEGSLPSAILRRVLWVDRRGVMQLSAPGVMHADAVRPGGDGGQLSLGPFREDFCYGSSCRGVQVDWVGARKGGT